LPFLAIAAFAVAVMLSRAPGQTDIMHLAITYLFFCWGLLLVWVMAGVARSIFLRVA
jgi:hypothetical protein